MWTPVLRSTAAVLVQALFATTFFVESLSRPKVIRVVYRTTAVDLGLPPNAPAINSHSKPNQEPSHAIESDDEELPITVKAVII